MTKPSNDLTESFTLVFKGDIRTFNLLTQSSKQWLFYSHKCPMFGDTPPAPVWNYRDGEREVFQRIEEALEGALCLVRDIKLKLGRNGDVVQFPRPAPQNDETEG